MPEAVVLEPWKRISHVPLRSYRHDPDPVEVECLDQFEGWLYEVLRDLTLNNQVHHREEHERLMRGLKARES
jgi:hypothetical protein